MRSTLQTARLATALLAVLAGIPTHHVHAADLVSLSGAPAPGETIAVTVSLLVGGNLKLAVPNDSDRDMPMSVAGDVQYVEKFLSSLPEHPKVTRSVRTYHFAQAALKIDKGGEKPALPTNRRLIFVHAASGATTLYSPDGPLTREQLDLIDLPGASTFVHRLLPGNAVAVGGTWQHDDQTLAALLGLEAVSFSDVQSMLMSVENNVAKVVLGGTVGGAVGGVGTQMEVKAKYNVDVKTKRITWFALLVKEKRASGHVNPGLDVVAKLVMKMSPVPTPEPLSEKSLARYPAAPRPEDLALAYRSPAGQFEFLYGRDWFVTGDEPDLVILRLVDRGELVAQCNLTLLKTMDPAKKPGLNEFQRDIEQALGKNFGRFVHASESTAGGKIHAFRVVCRGKSASLPVEWIYYLLTDPSGTKMSCVFTLEQDLIERFNGADKALISQIKLKAASGQTAAKSALKR